MPVRFGINFMPTAPAREVVRWAQLVESLGYELLGISDSQSICRDVYMTLALCAVNTERIRFGPRVITPVTRHPGVAASAAATLEELAPGRTLLAIGSGDSAAYNLGLRPASLAALREYAETIRSLLTHGDATYQGQRATLTWKRAPLPIYLAASGPKTLHLAGQIADGVVVRTGILPEIVRDSIAQVRRGAETAGRDPATIDLWWWPDVNVAASYREGVDEIKMSLAAAGNHLSRFTTEGKHIPPELLERVRTLGARYAFGTHTLPGSANNRLIEELGLVDYLADRFAAVGTPADCIRKLTAAIDAGARQFWMSVHFEDKERFLRDWAEKVAPAFR
jgi:alkanesulfonate monooxygenase SsuD/methylene tetrahydromethanopterin reductase-like flavin-dependent oxidoreductase (luciferase family)